MVHCARCCWLLQKDEENKSDGVDDDDDEKVDDGGKDGSAVEGIGWWLWWLSHSAFPRPRGCEESLTQHVYFVCLLLCFLMFSVPCLCCYFDWHILRWFVHVLVLVFFISHRSICTSLQCSFGNSEKNRKTKKTWVTWWLTWLTSDSSSCSIHVLSLESGKVHQDHKKNVMSFSKSKMLC